MNLAEFLKQRRESAPPAKDLHARIQQWSEAVGRLMARIRDVLQHYEDLKIQEYNVGLKAEGIRYSVAALTIDLVDAAITVEPKGMTPIDSHGRVEMSCGAKVVLLDWDGADGWFYTWSIPLGGNPFQPLTKEAIEYLVQSLLV